MRWHILKDQTWLLVLDKIIRGVTLQWDQDFFTCKKIMPRPSEILW